MRVNLIPPEERPVPLGTSRWTLIVGIVGVVLLLFVNGVAFLQYSTLREQKSELKRMEQIRLGLEQAQVQVGDLRSRLQDLETLEQAYSRLITQACDEFTISVLTTFGGHKGENIWIEDLEFFQSQFVVSGYAFDLGALSELLHLLSLHDYTVDVQHVSQNPSNPLVTFRFNIAKGR